jgi:hypothetical protein
MKYSTAIESALNDPKSLEELYQEARGAGETGEFAAEVASRYSSSRENVLLAAWYYRLQPEAARAASQTIERGREINWRLAIALSIALSVIYWLLAGDISSPGLQFPNIFLGWMPAAACMIIASLVLATWRRQPISGSARYPFLASPRGALLIIFGLVAITAYAYWMAASSHVAYRTLMVLHLPLLAWIAVLLYIVGPGSDDPNRFAALIKSAEIVLTGGIFFGAAMAFVAITMGLFGAIGVNFPEPVQRWLFVGVPGLIPVLAVALVYDPNLPPAAQRIDQGLPKLIFSVARIFLPFALMVGVIYILLIPANFFKPFEQREVLIVYNAMLFGVMALLVFATPLDVADVPERWRTNLRRAILALAVLTVLVSLYALSATVYRTVIGGLTINRVTVVGWNVINIALLCLFLYRQFRYGRTKWIPSTQSVFRIGIIGYAIWTVFIVVAIPILFS